MSFFRQEALDSVRRWALPLGMGAIGIALMFHGIPALWSGAWLALVPIALGLLALLVAIGSVQTALAVLWTRFGGPGLVTVEEGRISYFSPFGGAVLALDAIETVSIAAGPGVPGERAWQLSDGMGQQAVIPAGASGAAQLVDRLGTLPGFDTMQAVAAMQRATDGTIPLWQRAPTPADRHLA